MDLKINVLDCMHRV